MPAGGSGERRRVSSAGGDHPRWRGDGRELYYLDGEGRLIAVPVTVGASGIEVGSPRVLFSAGAVGDRLRRHGGGRPLPVSDGNRGARPAADRGHARLGRGARAVTPSAAVRPRAPGAFRLNDADMTLSPAPASVPTRSSRRSARAGWGRCTGRGTRGSGARSRSRCCRRRLPSHVRAPEAVREGGAVGLGAEPPQHRHDLRHRSADGVDRTSRWSSSTGRRCASCWRTGALPIRPLLSVAAQVGRRPGQGARRRDRAPGPEARERDGHQGRLRQDPGLRPGEADAAGGLAARRRRRRRCPARRSRGS